MVWDLTVSSDKGQEEFVAPGEYFVELSAGGSKLESRVHVQDGSVK